MTTINIDLENVWNLELKIIGFLLLVLSLFGIWFIFYIRSTYQKKDPRNDGYNTFLMFLFPIVIIAVQGISLLSDNPPVWLDYIMMGTPFAWLITFVAYETYLYIKNKNIQKDKGQ